MTANPWLAWPSGSDPARLASRARTAHEEFLTGGAPGAVRRVVLESWERSRVHGVDPQRPRIDVDLAGRALTRYRREHPLAPVMPVVRRALLEGMGDGALVAVGDASGRLLWVEGDPRVRRAMDRAGFVEGACWDERRAGTNAPGVALATDHEVQVFAAEHFSVAVQPWSCSAAPVHDPVTRALLGFVDLTGGDDVAAPAVLALVRATVMAIEAELAARALRSPRASAPTRPTAPTPAPSPTPAPTPTPTPPRSPSLAVLGRSAGLLEGQGDGPGVALGLRHTEILVLLAEHPEGLDADGLAVRLSAGPLSAVTVRAEVSRLRRVVPGLLDGSRPYRLGRALTTDAGEVRERLDAGDVAGAVRTYAGPVLPRSEAPGVVELRGRLAAEVRAAVDATDDVEAVLAWATGPGVDDWSAWRRLTGLLPPGSPRAARAAARLRLLEAELA